MFVPRVGIIINLKRFDILFDNKLFNIRLNLFDFFVEEQRWSIWKVVLLDPSILLGQKSAERGSKYLSDKA